MKRFAIIYLSTLVILLPVDLLFLGAVGKKLFADNVGDMTLSTPRWRLRFCSMSTISPASSSS